jgi:hypothetical protein
LELEIEFSAIKRAIPRHVEVSREKMRKLLGFFCFCFSPFLFFFRLTSSC